LNFFETIETSATAITMSATQQEDALDMIAQVSKLLRQGIANALPVAGDQYLTVSVPGTVIDTRDIVDGGSYVWTPSKTKDPFIPLSVQQAEANLTDGMMPISTVMIGNTGRSVARSYSRTLDLLIPLKAAGSPGLESEPQDPRYKEAMAYLQKQDENGNTPIDKYITKQTAWQQAQSEWDSAKDDAEARFQKQFPGDLAAIQQAMNEWNQVNFRKFKTNVQGNGWIGS
jgi:hypothetical protein